MTRIIDALKRSIKTGNPCVVATIIHVEGSAFQREGARCVILDNGEVIGILSGGCVETELIREADEIRLSGNPKLVHLDFSSEEELLFGYGSGCGGKLLILLELFNSSLFPTTSITLLEELANREKAVSPYYSVTVLESDDFYIYPIGKRWRADFDDPHLHPKNGVAGVVKTESEHVQLVLFVELVQPKPNLSIIGTGDDAVFLSRWAKQLNWHVRLVFHPTDRANASHFPDVDEVVHIPRCHFSRFPNLPHHYVVVMSHQFEIDLEAVKQLLPTSVCYIGLLGSRTRIHRILEAIKDEGCYEENLIYQKLFAPVGLDLGATTPEEITLSIMAELVAIHNKTGGGFLKERRVFHGTEK